MPKTTPTDDHIPPGVDLDEDDLAEAPLEDVLSSLVRTAARRLKETGDLENTAAGIMPNGLVSVRPEGGGDVFFRPEAQQELAMVLGLVARVAGFRRYMIGLIGALDPVTRKIVHAEPSDPRAVVAVLVAELGGRKVISVRPVVHDQATRRPIGLGPELGTGDPPGVPKPAPATRPPGVLLH